MGSGSISDIDVDQYRQGIYARGYAVHRSILPIISPEIDSFEIEQIVFGQPKSYSDNIPFQDLDNYDAVQFLNGNENPQCFPAILGNINIVDPSQMNGVLEPFSIRSKTSQNSIDHPYEAHDIRGSLQGGNEDPYIRTCIVSQFFLNKFPNTVVPFVDSEQLFGSTVSTSIKIPGYYSDKYAIIEPYDDDDAIEFEKLGVLIAGNDIIGALEPLNPNDDDLLPNNHRSAGAGFTYTYNVAGTDSIAFGGLLR